MWKYAIFASRGCGRACASHPQENRPAVEHGDIIEIRPSGTLGENEHKLLALRFLGSFGATNMSYDWLMVALGNHQPIVTGTENWVRSLSKVAIYLWMAFLGFALVYSAYYYS